VSKKVFDFCDADGNRLCLNWNEGELNCDNWNYDDKPYNNVGVPALMVRKEKSKKRFVF
jgi:hypothetical protein